MEKKIDLRIVKTKKNLYEALLKLMRKNTFESIKVSDICETALINRSTFYAHFNDKYELLNELIRDLEKELKSSLKHKSNIETTKEYYIELIKILFIHLEENIETYSAITLNNQNSIVMDMILNTLKEDVKNNIKDINSNIPIDFVSNFYISAVVNVLLDYLKNPNKYSQENIISYLEILLPENI